MKKILIFILPVLMFLQSCKKDDDVYTPGTINGTAISSIIQLDNKNTGDIPADQATKSVINIQVTPDALAANRVITLATTIGKFGNGELTSSVTVDAYGKGQFSITSGTIGTAVVTATVKSYSVSTTLKFVSAQPDDFLVSSDKYQMDVNSSAVITAKLFRNPGTGSVTDPVKIYFSVSGTPGSTLVLPEFAYSALGAATVTLSNPFMVTGSFTITATTVNQKGETLKKTFPVVIK